MYGLGYTTSQNGALNKFRCRLRNLLLSEEQQYLAEMASSEETVLERQAKMREKARALKERREIERQQFVEEKLAQQWRCATYVMKLMLWAIILIHIYTYVLP